MNYKEPEKLPKGTPLWFREWYAHSFWHFQYDIKSTQSRQGKLLYIILGAIIVAGVMQIFT